MNPTTRRKADIRDTKLAKHAKPGQNPVKIVYVMRAGEEGCRLVEEARRNAARLFADEYRVGFQ